MAYLPSIVETVKAVGIIAKADTTIQDLLFPTEVLHKTKTIEYDMATVSGEIVDFNSFSNTSNTIEKDGKTIVKLEVLNLNNSISKDDIDANVAKFGTGTIGIGNVDQEMEQALNGVRKIRLNHLATGKKSMYEALTTHKIANGYMGRNGEEDIVFPVPTANKTVLDGSSANEFYWSDIANAKPLTNIVQAYAAMVVKPSYVIMNEVSYSNFVQNAEVIPAIADGKIQNFVPNMKVEPASEAFYAGRIMHLGVILDVYVEKQRIGNVTPYMPTEFVVLAAPVGEMNYAGIPVAEKGKGVYNVRAKWLAVEVISDNPATHEVVVKTAPLPTLKNGEAYFSIRVEA